MKKLFNVLLILMIGLFSIFITSCGDFNNNHPTTPTEQGEDLEPADDDPVSEDPAFEDPTPDEGFNITFVVDEFVKVTVYATQELTNGVETLEAVSKDSAAGEALSDGNGQVNFSLSFTEGYELATISVEGSYKNLKYPFETGSENTYRITKVASNLTVTIASQEMTDEPTEEDYTDQFKVTFVLDEFVLAIIYKTQEMVDGVNGTVGYARDGSSGLLQNNGDGQINFVLSFTLGYMLDSIEVDGTYKNIKYPADTGVENAYRITKIQSDLTITITSKAKSDDLQSEYVISTTDGVNNYEMTLSTVAGSFYSEVIDGNLNVLVYESSEISVVGELYGSLIVCGNENYTLTLDLNGASITSYNTMPAIYIDQFDEVEISVKKGTVNNVFDNRDAMEELASAIYITCDTTFKGAGTLNVTSESNNGIHCKDDLTLQKLTLNVTSVDNALKGNDSLTINSGVFTLIAKAGDALKTSNSDVSSKGKQRGTITIFDGTLNLFAATDGIDEAYDVVIGTDTTSPTINIYTDKYSEYSEEVTTSADSIYYVRSTTTIYKYSIMYYNSATDYVWCNSTTYKTVNTGRNTYYYYEITKPAGYNKFNLFVYTSSQTQGQSSDYYASSGLSTINDNYDTIAYSNNRFQWTNYQTSQGGFGPGGMNEGNQDKGDYSTKGIKADNQITIENGVINIQSYDDAIHANNDVVLENNETALGNITINNGTLTLYSNDDGLHADGTLTINGGNIKVTNSYEGLEGNFIVINNGEISVSAKDDGVNATTTSGTALAINGGYLYVSAGGDGLDTNSRTSYAGIHFNGGNVIVISTSGGNSCIDTEAGYKYTSGIVVAMCPTGMTQETTKCTNFSSVGKTQSMSLTKGYYLTVGDKVVVKLPTSISNGFVMTLTGTNNISISQNSSTTHSVDANGVYIS